MPLNKGVTMDHFFLKIKEIQLNKSLKAKSDVKLFLKNHLKQRLFITFKCSRFFPKSRFECKNWQKNLKKFCLDIFQI